MQHHPTLEEEESSFESALKQLIDHVDDENLTPVQIQQSLNRLSSTLERFERTYQDTTDDPYEDNRNQYTIGKLLLHVKEDVIDCIFGSFVVPLSSANEAPPEELLVASLRFLLAAAPVIHPTTFISFDAVEKFIQWAQIQNVDDNLTQFAKRVYSTGLLSLTTSDDGVAKEVVEKQLASFFLKRLKHYIDTKLQSPPINKVTIGGDSRDSTFDELQYLEMRLVIQSLANIGDYQEVLPLVLEAGGIDITNSLLLHKNKFIVVDALKLVCALLAHNKYISLFVEKGGLKIMLKLPKETYLAAGIGLSLLVLAQNTLVMEKLVQYQYFVDRFVENGILLLDCASSDLKKNGCMFFSVAFSYKPILLRFDKQKGIKPLLNLLRLATSFPIEQTSKHVANASAIAIRSYLRAHVTIASISILHKQQVEKKPQSLDVHKFSNNQQFLDHIVPAQDASTFYQTINKSRWKVVNRIVENEGVELTLEILNHSYSWAAPQLTINILEILHLISLCSSTHLSICESKVEEKPGISLLLDCAAEVDTDQPDIIVGALNVIVNFATVTTTNKENNIPPTTLKVWELLRNYDGLRTLLDLLQYSYQPSHADAIRSLACSALIGLCLDNSILNILKQLNIRDLLLDVMKGSVDPDNHTAMKLREHANQLLKLTTGYDSKSIVTNTPITYDEKELLQLIHEYLLSRGLKQAANTLASEAKVETSPMAALSSFSAIPFSKGGIDESSLPARTKLNPWLLQQPVLDKIMVQYLRQQHEGCEHPISTLPPLSLTHKHQCPAPKTEDHIRNIARRLLSYYPLGMTKQQQHSTLAGTNSQCRYHDRKFIYSRFRRVKSAFVTASEDESINCCTYNPVGDLLAAGTEDGQLYIYNSSTYAQLQLHNIGSPIQEIKYSDNNQLMVTWLADSCKVWKTNSQIFATPAMDLSDSYYALFNHTSDQIIATRADAVCVYDIATGEEIAKLVEPDSTLRNSDDLNVACFNPYGDLILSDAVLWDFRTPPKILHKFQKLERVANGFFHRNGNEVIIGKGIWDLRMCKMLKASPSLELTKWVTWSPQNDILYATYFENTEELGDCTGYFRTIDSLSYDAIATVVLGKDNPPILDLSADPLGHYLAIVAEFGHNSAIRMYEIGRKRRVDYEDEGDEEDDEEEEGDGDGEEEGDDDYDDDDVEDDFDFDAGDEFGAHEGGPEEIVIEGLDELGEEELENAVHGILTHIVQDGEDLEQVDDEDDGDTEEEEELGDDDVIIQDGDSEEEDDGEGGEDDDGDDDEVIQID